MKVANKVTRNVLIGVALVLPIMLVGMKSEKKTYQPKGRALVLKETSVYTIRRRAQKFNGFLLNRPQKLLRIYKNFFGENIFACKFSRKEIKGFASESPLFFVHECFQSNCGLNRLKNPYIRDAYEQEVVKQLANNMTFVAFGCGGFLPTLRSLALFFRHHPTANVTCYAIDPLYTCFGGRGKVVEIVQENMCGVDDGLDDVVVDSWNEFFKQILSFIKVVYPQATFNLVLYNKAQDFQDDWDNGAVKEKPSLIVGEDFDMIPINKDDKTILDIPALHDYEMLTEFIACKNTFRPVTSVLLLKPLVGGMKEHFKKFVFSNNENALFIREISCEKNEAHEKEVRRVSFKFHKKTSNGHGSFDVTKKEELMQHLRELNLSTSD